MSRTTLPDTRESITHKFTIGNVEGYLTIGLDNQGQPREIFLKIAKAGSTLSGMCQGFCRGFSLAIQHGLSLQDAVRRFKGMKFDPQGPTAHPAIPTADSIIDYIARYLEHEFTHAEAAV